MALQMRRRQEEVARRKRSRAGRSRLEVPLITNSLTMLSWIDWRRSITYGLNTKATLRNGAKKKSLTSSQMMIKPSWTSCCERALQDGTSATSSSSSICASCMAETIATCTQCS